MHKKAVKTLCNVNIDITLLNVVQCGHSQRADTAGLNELKEDDKMLSTNEIIAKVKELREMEELIAEAQAEADAIKDLLKATLTEQNTEELEAGMYIIRYTSVLSNRFDSTAFKKVMPDVYKAYTKQVTSKRFTIS